MKWAKVETAAEDYIQSGLVWTWLCNAWKTPEEGNRHYTGFTGWIPDNKRNPGWSRITWRDGRKRYVTDGADIGRRLSEVGG